jgi:hypothetical protein
MDFVHEGISAESSMKDVTGQIIYQGESFAAKIQKLLARQQSQGRDPAAREMRAPAIPCGALS